MIQVNWNSVFNFSQLQNAWITLWITSAPFTFSKASKEQLSGEQLRQERILPIIHWLIEWLADGDLEGSSCPPFLRREEPFTVKYAVVHAPFEAEDILVGTLIEVYAYPGWVIITFCA